MLLIGEWRVDPVSGDISRDPSRGAIQNAESTRLEARSLRLLLCLAEHAGETVSQDDLVNKVWPDVAVSPDSVYQAIATLRRVLGDDAKRPAYIATIPRLGYRLLAPVGPWEEPQANQQGDRQPVQSIVPEPTNLPTRSWRRRPLVAGAAFFLVLMVGLVSYRLLNAHESAAAPALEPSKAVGVLPFLDLTEGMKNEEFADGITEELVDKLSKIPGLNVPSATASFYFKNKQVPLAEIASKLGVSFLLDGSVRKSSARLRVAARLVRADNGYVIWSETYDRPAGDLLLIQDDIASDVTSALSRSIGAR